MRIQIEVSKEAGVKFNSLSADTQNELFKIVDESVLTMPVEDDCIDPCRTNEPSTNAICKDGLTRKYTPPSFGSSVLTVVLLLSCLSVFSQSLSRPSQAARLLPKQECPAAANVSSTARGGGLQPSNIFWRAASDRATSIRHYAGLHVASNKESANYLLRLASPVSSFSVSGVYSSKGQPCR
jgi:hypothetical protein